MPIRAPCVVWLGIHDKGLSFLGYAIVSYFEVASAASSPYELQSIVDRRAVFRVDVGYIGTTPLALLESLFRISRNIHRISYG